MILAVKEGRQWKLASKYITWQVEMSVERIKGIP